MIGALRRRRGSLAWLLLMVATAGVLIVLALVPLLRAPVDGRIGSLVGREAPDLSGTTLAGDHWTLADATDDAQVVWVNFWATSCEPCRTEMPAMQTLAEEYAPELAIVGVDWGESRESVTDFVRRYGVSYPILMDPDLDNYYRWADTDGLPRHYFVDSSGTVVREVIGPLDPAEMVTIVDELLATGPAG